MKPVLSGKDRDSAVVTVLRGVIRPAMRLLVFAALAGILVGFDAPGERKRTGTANVAAMVETVARVMPVTSGPLLLAPRHGIIEVLKRESGMNPEISLAIPSALESAKFTGELVAPSLQQKRTERQMKTSCPHVYIYSIRQPQRSASGHTMRFYSNTRAYLDLGYKVETVQISNDAEWEEGNPPGDLTGLRYKTYTVPPAQPPRIASRFLYRLGISHPWSLSYYFPCHMAVREAVLERERQTPGAIHQLEADTHVNAVFGLPRLRFIFGHHDIYSDVVRFVQKIAQEQDGNRPPTAAELREQRFVEKYERRVPARVDTILCGSLRDRDLIRNWGIGNAEYLPCSTFDETICRHFTDEPAGPLRIVHVGKINHVPTFRSLDFLLTNVWPHLPASLRSQVQLRVIGRMIPGHPLCERIREMAAPYPEIEFTGFVPDLAGELEKADLHIVLATAATGYRTRIIESFAAGVPVLSNDIAADGLEALRPGENILIASEPGEVIETLNRLVQNRAQLARIAGEAAATYRDYYSRPVVARRLDEIIQRTFPDAG